MSFPYFVMKKAPVSGVESLMDYRRFAHRRTARRAHRVVDQGGGRGGPACVRARRGLRLRRAQPGSHITITAKTREHIWIEELIDVAEEKASCELYGILKRPDEKYVTEHAYDNPKFVEDMVRDIALRMNKT